MKIKLSVSYYDIGFCRLCCLDNNGDKYCFMDEWSKNKQACYPVLYTCTPEDEPYIPLYEIDYAISRDTHVWNKYEVEKFQSIEELYRAICNKAK